MKIKDFIHFFNPKNSENLLIEEFFELLKKKIKIEKYLRQKIEKNEEISKNMEKVLIYKKRRFSE